MTTDNWFAAIVFFAVYAAALLLLDTAHRSHISELKQIHREQVAGLRSYIRTLSRANLWQDAELQRLRNKLREREQVSSHVEHIEWMPTLPPSEEWNEDN